MIIHDVSVRGNLMDAQTRCTHYHTKKDIVAIKFACCHTYYPCFACHEEEADHPAKKWEQDKFDERAILCGACGTELTIQQYVKNGSACPTCKAQFNPNCERHLHFYFEI